MLRSNMFIINCHLERHLFIISQVSACCGAKGEHKWLSHCLIEWWNHPHLVSVIFIFPQKRPPHHPSFAARWTIPPQPPPPPSHIWSYIDKVKQLQQMTLINGAAQLFIAFSYWLHTWSIWFPIILGEGGGGLRYIVKIDGIFRA